ncbi:hypothetical protein [Xanthomonas tesorieronis]|uniref:hypothetical protein n=1 Tax=Xanthomonas tesorieronis TaxID=3160839 RepID=UPI003512C633
MPTIAPFAYLAYLLWLGAGLGDFLLHRRSHLPVTSGLRESLLHHLQLLCIGLATLGWLSLQPSLAQLCVLALLVVVHALVGYWDTRAAYGVRAIGPLEQHVHSVLDMAPWIGLGWVASHDASTATQAGWVLAWRVPSLPLPLWVAVLVPAAAMTVLPALAETLACLRVRAQRKNPRRA